MIGIDTVTYGTTYLLINLQAINNGRKLAHDLVSLLVVLHLGSDELSKVAKRLRGIKDLSSND